jgi:hypothetical protein
MNSQPRIPTALSVLSYLFLVYGLWGAAIQVIQLFLWLKGYGLGLHPEIICIWVFAGLRRRSRGWRVFALALIWLSIAVALFGSGYMLVFREPVAVNGWGHTRFVSPLVGVALTAPFLLLSFWAYWVLTRPDVRCLFGDGKDQAPSITGENTAPRSN